MKAKDDFDRDVYCLAGLPIDAVDISTTLTIIQHAMNQKERLFFTTPNLNFVIACESDSKFRDSVINSDLVVADGISILIIAKMMGVPIRTRVAGSTIFEYLSNSRHTPKHKIYFFGGPEFVAHKAMQVVNANSNGLECVGAKYPGFRSVDEMSQEEFIDDINLCNPDFLIVSLGAKKGQAWIENNLIRLNVPVVSHLGAVVNFAAVTIKRAPMIFQTFGLEWLWRIKEEPSLWRRYFYDAIALVRLMIFNIAPLMLYTFWTKVFISYQPTKLFVEHNDDVINLNLSGSFSSKVSEDNRAIFREIAHSNKTVFVDCNDLIFMGSSMLGLFLLLNKHLSKQNRSLIFINLSKKMKRILKLNAMGYFVSDN